MSASPDYSTLARKLHFIHPASLLSLRSLVLVSKNVLPQFQCAVWSQSACPRLVVIRVSLHGVDFYPDHSPFQSCFRQPVYLSLSAVTGHPYSPVRIYFGYPSLSTSWCRDTIIIHLWAVSETDSTIFLSGWTKCLLHVGFTHLCFNNQFRRILRRIYHLYNTSLLQFG